MGTLPTEVLEAKDQLKAQDEAKPEEKADPTEEAAYFINEAHKAFKKLSYALADRKRHSMSRVLEAVLFEPLEEVELFGKEEQEMFALCKDIMYNKGIVLRYAYDRIESKQGEKNESTETV
jgi:predicted lipid-binding transport protein (Tim44 family)